MHHAIDDGMHAALAITSREYPHVDAGRVAIGRERLAHEHLFLGVNQGQHIRNDGLEFS